MRKRRTAFQRAILACLLCVVLLPFASRQLLSLGLHCAPVFPQPALSNKGQGRRLGKNLIRQLESQAQTSGPQAEVSPVFSPGAAPVVFSPAGPGFKPFQGLIFQGFFNPLRI